MTYRWARPCSPDGSRLVVSNDGQGVQSLQLIDTSTGKVTQTLAHPDPAALYSGSSTRTPRRRRPPSPATPYTAVKPRQNLKETNPANAPDAAVSNAQPLTKEDQIDEQTFNEAIWHSVKSANSVMPAPRHHVFPAPPPGAKDDDDDDN